MTQATALAATAREQLFQEAGLPVATKELPGRAFILAYQKDDEIYTLEGTIASRHTLEKKGSVRLVLKLNAAVDVVCRRIIWHEGAWHLFTNYEHIQGKVVLHLL
ncbi:MAG: hypothetical protein U0517_04215 [Candidatus Andersenbacteria bacterium]